MSINKKITFTALIVLIAIILGVFLKLAFSHINSSYLDKRITSYIFQASGKKIELDEVRLRLMKGIGLAITIPNAEIYLNENINASDTIIDINIISILLKGINASELKITSQLNLSKDQRFNVEIVSKDEDITIKKFSSNNFSLIDDIDLKNNNYHIININSVFSKKFVDQNLERQLKKIKIDHGIEL